MTVVRFYVQLEWTRERLKAMTTNEEHGFVKTLSRFNGLEWTEPSWTEPDWTEPEWTESRDDVFELGNGNRPLGFYLNPDGIRYVQVRGKNILDFYCGIL